MAGPARYGCSLWRGVHPEHRRYALRTLTERHPHAGPYDETADEANALAYHWKTWAIPAPGSALICLHSTSARQRTFADSVGVLVARLARLTGFEPATRHRTLCALRLPAGGGSRPDRGREDVHRGDAVADGGAHCRQRDGCGG